MKDTAWMEKGRSPFGARVRAGATVLAVGCPQLSPAQSCWLQSDTGCLVWGEEIIHEKHSC